MTGGMICPPVEAAASTAPAKEPGNPRFLIRGMVTAPVPTTFDTTLPDDMPKTLEAIIAAWAGPPRVPPVARSAMRIITSPAPVPSSKAPNTMKMKTNSTTTPVGESENALEAVPDDLHGQFQGKPGMP